MGHIPICFDLTTLAADAITTTTSHKFKKAFFGDGGGGGTAFCYVVQAGPNLLILMPHLSGARITGVYHHTA